MSAHNMVHSISAPPWCVDMKSKQEVHQVGFMSEGRLPRSLMNGAAGPAKGAAQRRQRGSPGTSFRTRRIDRSRESPLLRYSRQYASFLGLGCSDELTIRLWRKKRIADLQLA